MSERLVKALEECLEWMEDLRISGDAGFWEWSETHQYTTGKKALAEHKGNPVLSEEELFQNGRQLGFREGFSAGRKSAGLKDIEVRFESFHEKATLSEKELVEIILDKVGAHIRITHVTEIIKALHDAGALNVKGN